MVISRGRKKGDRLYNKKKIRHIINYLQRPLDASRKNRAEIGQKGGKKKLGGKRKKILALVAKI